MANKITEKLLAKLVDSKHGVVGRMVRENWESIDHLQSKGYGIRAIFRVMKEEGLLVACSENGFRMAVKKMDGEEKPAPAVKRHNSHVLELDKKARQGSNNSNNRNESRPGEFSKPGENRDPDNFVD